MQTLTTVLIPDYTDSQENLMWTQADALRKLAFDAAAIIALQLTRGEGLQLLDALTGKDSRPAVTCPTCQRTMAPGRGRIVTGGWFCYHCVIIGGLCKQ